MNAYELAQYLEIAFYEDEDIEKAATMLRQQADRIAELENKSKPLSDEEIMQISHQALENSALTPKNNFMIAFARAIEKRHGIK